MFTASTPRRTMSCAPSSTFFVETPRGGSSSTLTTNFPRSCARNGGSGPAGAGSAGRGAFSSTRTSAPGASFSAGRREARRSCTARTCAGVVPQQPPTRRTPISTARAANSAK